MNKPRKSNVNENNFRPANNFSAREETKGTKPLAEPLTVKGALLTMFLHGCRRLVLGNTKIRVAIYVGVLFVSFIWDFAPLPKTYFSRSSNALNQYFVKLSWMWTLMWTVPFVLLTSLTYCCGSWKLVKWHIARVGVATIFWFVTTKSFVYYENSYGRCSVKSFASKQLCLNAGHFWHSVDISGHAFILIFSSLMMVEEARAIVGWESIEHLIRDEMYNRSVKNRDLSSPLKNLTDEQMKYLNTYYTKFTPYIKGLFIAMTLLMCLWDIMVLSTALYFHKMIEKLIGGLIAILLWFLSYKYWYSNTNILPYAPGLGSFIYQSKLKSEATRQGSLSSSRPPVLAKPAWLKNNQSQGAQSISPNPGLEKDKQFVDPFVRKEKTNSRGGVTTRTLTRASDKLLGQGD